MRCTFQGAHEVSLKLKIKNLMILKEGKSERSERETVTRN